ncbi:MAG: hypothetical protein P1U57_10950 [Oleibacter sp.]|nr:hypothetical protein [Thalassolituus sp.]
MIILGDFLWVNLLLAPLALLILIMTIRNTNWSAFKQHKGAQHFFGGITLILIVFWTMRAGISPGLHFHALGFTALTLLMGWPFALLSSALIVSAMVILGKITINDVALSWLLVCVVPIAFTYFFYRLVDRFLPHNPFVYILVAGFFNAGITQAVYALLAGGWYAMTGVYSVEHIWDNYWCNLPLMMFPEGIMNGMFIAGMVSFSPQWLSTFDEQSYFGEE